MNHTRKLTIVRQQSHKNSSGRGTSPDIHFQTHNHTWCGCYDCKILWTSYLISFGDNFLHIRVVNLHSAHWSCLRRCIHLRHSVVLKETIHKSFPVNLGNAHTYERPRQDLWLCYPATEKLLSDEHTQKSINRFEEFSWQSWHSHLTRTASVLWQLRGILHCLEWPAFWSLNVI